MIIEVHTKKTGWVQMLKDHINSLTMWLAVPGYTFYIEKYQNIDGYREKCEDCDEIYINGLCPNCDNL